MRYLRSSLLVFVLALGVATAAWALNLTVSFRLPPLVNKVKPTAVVDETGNVLLGSTPGQVAVTNLPAVQDVNVTNFPSTSSGGCCSPEIVSIHSGGDSSGQPVTLYTVPANRTLIVTDVEVSQSSSAVSLAVSGVSRLVVGSPTEGTVSRNYTSGVVFVAGETMQGFFNANVTVMGRLVPNS